MVSDDNEEEIIYCSRTSQYLYNLHWKVPRSTGTTGGKVSRRKGRKSWGSTLL